jgi:hypothetical protein
MLNLAVGIWILSLNEPDLDDDLSIQIFALIYGHELLHVLDEIEILSWLPPRLLSETAIQQYLVQGQTFTYGTSSQRIAEVEREFREHIRRRIEGEVLAGWAPETNPPGGLPHAPTGIRDRQQKVDTLRARQINRPKIQPGRQKALI